MKAGQRVTLVEDGTAFEATIIRVHGDEPGPKVLDLSTKEMGDVKDIRHVSVAGLDETHWTIDPT